MSPHPAVRRGGTCAGSLWKSHARGGSPASYPPDSDRDSVAASASLDGLLAEANERRLAHEYCVLVGNHLRSYSDAWAHAKGDPPTSEIRIVGASAWNPPSAPSRSPLRQGRGSSPSASLASEAATSNPSLMGFKSLDFLIVSYSGTHVRCSAPTAADKDKWLAALHAGLEGNITENRVETLVVLSKPHRRIRQDDSPPLGGIDSAGGEATREAWDELRRMCAPRDAVVRSAISEARAAFEAEAAFRPMLPPLPGRRTGTGRAEAGGGATSDGAGPAVAPPAGYRSPCDDRDGPPVAVVHCTACGKFPPLRALRIDGAPLPVYGMEVRADLCHDCWVAEGVLRHVRRLGWLYEAEARGRAAVRAAWEEVRALVEGRGARGDGDGGGGAAVDELPRLAEELVELASTESFVAYRQRSDTLDALCRVLEARKCAADFLESLEECSRAAESSCLHPGEEEDPGREDAAARPKETICLKKEAFKVAGDMSAALKLLYEYALPPERRVGDGVTLKPTQSRCPPGRDDADMLAAILEFFLDLCDEGQVDAVAFFWPQLCHIHMQMLPPRDAEEMIRVELFEDFLLTVATRHSVHLALALVWGLVADLEEGLGVAPGGNPLSRRRRFAVLRFASELESLLFDFDGGWGGGGASLQGMLAPSQHQAVLLRDAMALLQLRRRFGSHYLTRSVRLDKLRAEALEAAGGSPSPVGGRGAAARVARNAAYFSSHVALSRRLGDIAEKLRFTPVDQRDKVLREELIELNAVGKILGGDPLNRLCGGGRFHKMVHIPINEGHVFRSKERTPVLLLAELVEEGPPEVSSESCESLPRQNSTDVAGTDLVDENDANAVSSESVDPPDDQSQKSASSLNSTDKSNDMNGSGADGLSYPSSPHSPHRPSINDSDESPGRLPTPCLALTPRASEATNVTKEGKAMMADMIATLIDNQKKHVPAPPLLDDMNPDTDHESNGETRHPYQPSELDKRRDRGNTGDQEVKASNSSRSTPAALARMPSGIGKRISTLGSVSPLSGSADFSRSSAIHLTADGQFRRDVLFAIMERGMRGSNVIAKGAATAARRAIQTMDRKRAIALMNEPAAEAQNHGKGSSGKRIAEPTQGRSKQMSSDITINASIDEGEVMEALRLLIIQNQVAQENLSVENAVKENGTRSDLAEADSDAVQDRNRKGVDAGEVDHRLAGCGQISSSVLSALRLWKGGIVSSGELLELVQKDLQFLKQSAVFGSANESKLIEDSKFWGRFSFGERWAEKKARLAASSPNGSLPGWDLVGYIVKSNDDLRQEAFVMQLIGLCADAFRTAGLDLFVHPYGIVATGLTTGIIECVRNAMSFDSLKKRPGYGTDGLVGHFQRMTEIAADPFKALNEAKQNFVSSLAAYSLMSYLFMFKDRHNGNLLLDTAGHVIHIDFGFVFGIAPGGSFSLEQSTPFKLTDEMLEVMGGLGSPLFSEFVTLFCCGFLALQAHADTFLTVVEVTCRGSNFPCFDGKDPEEVLLKLRERFCPDLNKSQTVAYALDLIKFATTSYGTKQYDYFQYLSQGIAT